MIRPPNFIQRCDNLLSRNQCSDIINYVSDKLIADINAHTQYEFYHTTNWDPELKPLQEAIAKLSKSYRKNYPEIDNLDIWNVEYLRIKKWAPGKHYSVWHSEHTKDCPFRVSSFLIYLSDNNSYTEFKRHGKVKTKLGRGIMFPAYFTHEHRGSICKSRMDRYIASGYFSFVN